MVPIILCLSFGLSACGAEPKPTKPAEVRAKNILETTQIKLDNANKTAEKNLKEGIKRGEYGEPDSN
jgi:hypothetical protein